MIGTTTTVLSLFLLFAAPVFANGTARVQLSIPGENIFHDSTKEIHNSFNVRLYDDIVSAVAMTTGEVSATALVSGIMAAQGQGTATNSVQWTLRPPPGANFASGKLFVYAALTNAEVSGDASLDLKLDVRASRPWTAEGNNHRTVIEGPGDESVEFEVVVDLPAALDSTQEVTVDTSLVLDANARIAPVNGERLSASATADDNFTAGRIIGFRVLDAKGAQIPGFTLSRTGSAIPERKAAPPGMAVAVEYYYPLFEHYFITSDAAEIATLDSGKGGWQRTGESFNVFTTGESGGVQICRFQTKESAFPGKSSHFFAPVGPECDAALANPDWMFENYAFYLPLPDASGNCPASTVPVYRLYNDGQGGAPNHRFTTSQETQIDMTFDGWKAEGSGAGVVMCSPQ